MKRWFFALFFLIMACSDHRSGESAPIAYSKQAVLIDHEIPAAWCTSANAALYGFAAPTTEGTEFTDGLSPYQAFPEDPATWPAATSPSVKPWVSPAWNTIPNGTSLGKEANETYTTPFPASYTVTSDEYFAELIPPGIITRARADVLSLRVINRAFVNPAANPLVPVRYRSGSFSQRFKADAWAATGNAGQGITLFAVYMTSWDTYDVTWRHDDGVPGSGHDGLIHVKQKACGDIYLRKPDPVTGSFDLVTPFIPLNGSSQPISIDDGLFHTLKVVTSSGNLFPSGTYVRIKIYVDGWFQAQYQDDAPLWTSGTFGTRVDSANMLLEKSTISN